MHGKRIAELDIVRGMAIFGVLVLHSSFEGRFTRDTLAVQAIMARFFDWAVLAFFFSSGCLHDRLVPFTITLKKRWVSLLVPFFLYNALYNSCFVAIDSLGLVHKGDFKVNADLLAAGLFRSPAFQLYFLPYLFIVSIGVCALEKLIPRRYGWVYLVLSALVLAFYLDRGYPEASYGPELDKLPLYLAAFLIGVVGGPFFKKPVAWPWVMVAALVVALGVIVFLQFREVSLLVPPLVVGVAGAARWIRESKPLLSLGAMSGSIYVWHTPVMLPAITTLFAYVGVPSLFNLFGSIGLALVTCILLRRGLDALFVQVTKKQTPRYITL